MKKAPKRRAPKHWPEGLRRQFDTPIAIDWQSLNENDIEGHSRAILGKGWFSKLSHLADHYGVSIKAGEPPVLLALFLCLDLFSGFEFADDTTLKSEARRTNELRFVLKIEQIKMKYGIGTERACRKLIELEPAIYGGNKATSRNARARSLKARYMEAKKNPIIAPIAVYLAAAIGTSEK